MSTLNQGQDVRLIQGGILVTKSAVALPLNTTQNLFQVNGGQVFINALVGQVVSALGSTAQTVALGFQNANAVGGTSTTCMGTGGSVTSLGIGAQITANPGGATTVSPTEPNTGLGSSTGVSVTTMKSPYLVPSGTITTTTNANNGTGTVQWYCMYTPLDTGANVTSL